MMPKAKFYAQRLFTKRSDNLETIKNEAILIKQLFARYFSRRIRVTKCKTIHIVALENDKRTTMGTIKTT
jgi:hypothetical protein